MGADELAAELRAAITANPALADLLARAADCIESLDMEAEAWRFDARDAADRACDRD